MNIRSCIYKNRRSKTKAESVVNDAESGAGSAAKARKQELVNSEWLAELDLAEAVAQATLVEGRGAVLEAEGVTSAFAQGLLGRVSDSVFLPYRFLVEKVAER